MLGSWAARWFREVPGVRPAPSSCWSEAAWLPQCGPKAQPGGGEEAPELEQRWQALRPSVLVVETGEHVSVETSVWNAGEVTRIVLNSRLPS